MGPSRGMPQDTATRGRMTPLFWGGSLPSSAFLPRPQREGRFKTANHNRLRQIEESGFAALLDLAMPYPPLCARGNLVRYARHKKHPIIRLSQPISSRSANRTARHVQHWSIETPSVTFDWGIL